MVDSRAQVDAEASTAHGRRENPAVRKSYDAVDSKFANVVAVFERSQCCASHRTIFAVAAGAAWFALNRPR
jgi:hypothetical protein